MHGCTGRGNLSGHLAAQPVAGCTHLEAGGTPRATGEAVWVREGAWSPLGGAPVSGMGGLARD